MPERRYPYVAKGREGTYIVFLEKDKGRWLLTPPHAKAKIGEYGVFAEEFFTPVDATIVSVKGKEYLITRKAL